jgi:hypothetical protein
MANYTDKLIVLDSGQLKKISSADTVEITGTLTATTITGGGAGITGLSATNIATGTLDDARLSANVALENVANSFSATQTMTGLQVNGDAGITGNLTVSGDIISQGQVNVLISDSFLDLASGNVGTSALAGGFTVNVKKATGFTAETVTTFVAGSTSGPTFTVSGGSTVFADGDIVQISGAAVAANNGLYVVDGTPVAGVVTVKGTGGTSLSPNTPFAQSQFTAASSQSATAVKVDLAAFAVSGGGLTKSGGSAIAAGTFCYNYQAAATEALFTSSWTAITTVSTPSLQAVYDVSGAVTLTNGSDLAISKPTSGTAAVILGANKASKFEVDQANLTLSTLTSGAVAISSAGAATIDGTSFSIDATGTSNVTATGGNLTLSTASSGDLLLSSVGAGDFQVAGALTIDSSGGSIGIGTDSATGAISIGTNGARTISIGSASATAASVTASGDVSLVSSANVVLNAGASGKIDVQDKMILAAAGGVDLSVADGVAAGDILFVNSSGVCAKAENDVSASLEVDGVALEANSSGSPAPKQVASVFGSKVYIAFTTAPTAGDIAWLSGTAGKATGYAPGSAPTSGRLFRIGKVLSGSAVGDLYPVLFKPQYIADI